MKIWRGFLVRHAVASLGSVFTLAIVPIVFYLLGIIISGDVGGLLNLVLIPFCCSTGSVVLTVAVFVPIAALGEYVLVQRMSLRWWLHMPAMALIFFALGFLIVSIIPLFSGKNQFNYPLNAALVGGIPLMLAGLPYWCILRLFAPRLSEGGPARVQATRLRCDEADGDW